MITLKEFVNKHADEIEAIHTPEELVFFFDSNTQIRANPVFIPVMLWMAQELGIKALLEELNPRSAFITFSFSKEGQTVKLIIDPLNYQDYDWESLDALILSYLKKRAYVDPDLKSIKTWVIPFMPLSYDKL